MEIELIIESTMGLIAILAVLLFLLFANFRKKQKKDITPPIEKEPIKENTDIDNIDKEDIDSLIKIIKDKTTKNSELSKVIDLIIKNHGKIPDKLGTRIHPEFKTYVTIIFAVCRHPNADKDLVLRLDRELKEINPDYHSEIDDAILRGLS
jgi:hypothetical protein